MISGCFDHGHLKCPKMSADKKKNKRTRSQRSFEDENKFYAENMDLLKQKFPKDIEKISTVWHCELENITSSDVHFYNQILPKLKYFDRLKPRDAMVGGYRLLNRLKWDALENLESQLLFLDINGSFAKSKNRKKNSLNSAKSRFPEMRTPVKISFPRKHQNSGECHAQGI